jgi:hypothetical protein
LSQISRAYRQNTATDRQRIFAAITPESDETLALQAFAVTAMGHSQWDL